MAPRFLPLLKERMCDLRAEALHYSASDMALAVSAGRKRQHSCAESCALSHRRPGAGSVIRRSLIPRRRAEAMCSLRLDRKRSRLTGAWPHQSGRVETAAASLA